MAATIQQTKLAIERLNATISATFGTSPQATGVRVIAARGHWYQQSGNTLSITTPATGYMEHLLANATNFRVLANVMSDTWTSGDGDTVTSVKSGSPTVCAGLALLELAGAGIFDVGSVNQEGDSLTCVVPATAAVAENGSIALAIFFRHALAEAVGTVQYSGGFSEVAKLQSTTAGDVEIYVASLAVNATDTPACTFTTDASAEEVSGFVVVFGPSIGGVAPQITVPGARHAVRGVDHTITGITIDDVDGGDIDVTIATDEGTLALADEGTLAVTGSGTATLVATGTPAELAIITSDGLVLQSTGVTAASGTITVDAVDAEANNAVQRSIGITFHDAAAIAATQAGVNTILDAAKLIHDTAEAVTITMTAIDDAGRTDSDQATVTFNALPAPTDSSVLLHRRRRRLSYGGPRT